MDTCTTEQRQAIEAILKGESVFITGPGGTGKSYLLQTLYEEYKKTGRTMAVTAMTGCAALLLGPHAKTLHSWAGIGLGKEPASAIISAISTNGKRKKNWKNTDCLIIDEVSMLTPEVLELIDTVGRAVRKTRDKPMGGIQVVFVGDFYQLPPITSDGQAVKFAFNSPVWNTIIQRSVQLTTILRQRDPLFHTILQEARVGELSEESYKILLQRKGLSWKKNVVRPTLLFTRNADVSAINQKELSKLPGETVVYKVKTVALKDELEVVAIPQDWDFRIKKLDKDAPYEPELSLKVGAQVMLLTNLEPELGLVNGSRGVVKSFSLTGPVVEFLGGGSYCIKPHTWKSDGDDPFGRQQFPLRVAYALTIHKAQGASLDSAMVDIGEATFECGQAYVALSRVRSLEALYVYQIDKDAFRVHPSVKAFYSGLDTIVSPPSKIGTDSATEDSE